MTESAAIGIASIQRNRVGNTAVAGIATNVGLARACPCCGTTRCPSTDGALGITLALPASFTNVRKAKKTLRASIACHTDNVSKTGALACASFTLVLPSRLNAR